MNLFFRKSGHGKPLIILHGLFGNSDNWQYLARKFSQHFAVFTPDLRNHGQSPHSDLMDYDILSDDINVLIHQQEITNIFLIGHSLGGKIAMNFALCFPDLISKLIIVDIAPKSYDVIHDKYVDSLLKLNLNNFSKREKVDQALAESIGNLSIRQLLLKNLKREDNGRFSWKINLNGIKKNLPVLGAPVTSDYPFLKPTLFIAGGKSDYIKSQDLAEIKILFPLSEVTYIRNAGHWVHAEAPDQFYNEVLNFLHE